MMNDLKILPIFLEIISESFLFDHREKNEYFYNKIKELKKQKGENLEPWLCNTFTSRYYYDLDSDEQFRGVLTDVKKSVLRFAEYYGTKNVSPILLNSWINLAQPGNYQEYHIHTNSHISVVYFIKIPKDSGSLVFRSHSADKDMLELPTTELTPPSFKTWRVEPVENKLVMFKSNLSHMVERNKSNEDRVTIAMNFFLKEN